MRTVIIGGGKSCRQLLDLARSSFLKEMKLDVLAVLDIKKDAPGLIYAESIGIPIFTDLKSALKIPNIDAVIELTGNNDLLELLKKELPKGIKLLDHETVRIFWDLINAKDEQDKQLSKLKDYEESLIKERRFLQSIFDNISDLAVVLDPECRIIRINEKFSKFAGILQIDAIGKNCSEVLEDTELRCDDFELQETIKMVVSTGESITFLKKTEKNHWEISRAPIKDEQGNVVAILSTWHKITERIRLYEDKESAEHKFKSFIDSANDWISIKDLEGRYLIANPVTAKALGLDANEFIGRRPEEILDKKLARTIIKHDQMVINSGQHMNFNEIIPIEGTDHQFQTIRFPLSDHKGKTIGVCTIARDITNEVRLKEQLVQSEKLAALGKLAAGVAHEINNPLTGILAFAEDIREEYQSDDFLVEDMSVIVRETLRCRDIVRNLLDFAKQDTPKFENRNCNDIVINSLNLVEKLPQFKDINIELEHDEHLPNIDCDPAQLQQVILNFMLNAADAMKLKGDIYLSTEYSRRNSSCIISVEDNGPGIPENLIDKIFEPFFSTKGTNGLGLAVSWGIVERHNGTIEIDMSDSGGAIFRIVLPVHRN